MDRPGDFAEHAAVFRPIQRYGVAVDDQAFEIFAEIFTADAVLDYSAAGGPCGTREGLGEWLRASRGAMLQWQHHLSPPFVEVTGDRATARTDVYTPCVFPDGEGGQRAFHTGGRYHDELVRLEGRWWIRARRYEPTWSDAARGRLSQ